MQGARESNGARDPRAGRVQGPPRAAARGGGTQTEGETDDEVAVRGPSLSPSSLHAADTSCH